MNTIDRIILIGGCSIALIIFIVKLIIYFLTPLNVEYLIVNQVGDKGSGKTTLACALADLFHRKYEPYVRQEIDPQLEFAKQNGFSNIELPQDTLVFADTKVFTRKDKKHKDEYVRAYDCDISKFRLPTENNYKLIDYYPFGSFMIYDEIANKALSRDFANFSRNLSAMLNLTRKFYYNIYFLWPDFTGTDKIIRQSCHILRFVQGCELDINKKGEIKGITWWFVDYYGKNKVANFESGVVPKGRYEPFKLFKKHRKEITKYVYHYKGDISKICSTREELLYLLLHFKKWTLKKQKDYQITRADVIEFCKKNPAFADNIADVLDNRTIAEKRKGTYKIKERDNEE